MAGKSADIHARMRVLREAYAAQLPDKLDEIELQWQAVTADWNLDAVQLLHRLTHSLTGSAGTFGFIKLSEKARAIEQVLKEYLREGGQRPGDTQQAHMQEMLGELREAASASPVEIGDLPFLSDTPDKKED